MRISTAAITAIALFFLVAAPVAAQTIQKGTISGVITSASVDVPINTTAEVYTTPTDPKLGLFILTQVCVEDRKDLELSGSTMGPIVLDNDCTTYEPGIAVPAGEVLSFTETNNGNRSGMVTGILSKK